jgi:hypothetical protein
LYNIEASYNLNNEAVYHSNDATSVGVWVEKLKSDDKLSLVYYKSQGQIDTNNLQLKEDDFLLLIMNVYLFVYLEFNGTSPFTKLYVVFYPMM